MLVSGDRWLDAPWVVDGEVTIVGRPGARLLCSAPSAVIVVRPGGRLIVRDVAITHVGPAPASVVVVAGGEVYMAGCRLTGAVGRPALLAYAAAAGGLAGCEVSGNGADAMRLDGRAALALVDNRVADNCGAGIVYAGRAAGVARANQIEGCTGDGIRVAGRAWPVLEANLLLGNGGAGMTFTGRSRATAYGNYCQGNGGPGLDVVGDAWPTADENTSIGNAQLWRLGTAYLRTAVR